MPIMEDSDVFAAKRKAALKDKADSLNNLLAITGTCGRWVVTRAGSLYFDEEGPKNPEIERRYQDYLLRECASRSLRGVECRL